MATSFGTWLVCGDLGPLSVGVDDRKSVRDRGEWPRHRVNFSVGLCSVSRSRIEPGNVARSTGERVTKSLGIAPGIERGCCPHLSTQS
ncbi:MAG: hypothetical protein ACI8TP_003964 [Acidimicrobiales bacterium]|jgi:hypothetical protein